MNFVKTRPRPHPHTLEATALIFATPFLLFPTTFPLITTLALGLLALTWLWQWFQTRQPFPHTPFNVPLLLWGVMILVGTLVSADVDLTLPKLTGLLLGLGVWRFVVRCGREPRMWLWGFWGLIGLGVSFALVGMLSTNWVFEVGFVAKLFGVLPPRLVVLPGAVQEGIHMNELGGTVAMFPALLLSAGWGMRPHRFSWLFLLLLVGNMLLLLLTQSRSGWLGAAAGLGTLFLLWSGLELSPRPRIRVWFAAVFTTLLAVLFLLSRLSAPQVEFLLGEIPGVSQSETQYTLDTRLEIWRWSIEAVGDFPYTGVGLGTWRRVGYRLYPFQLPYTYDISHAHNIFMQVALDVGLPGLMAYVALVGLAGWTGWRVVRQDKQLRPQLCGLLAALVAWHVFGLLDALAPGSKPGLLFWVVLGLIAAAPGITRLSEKLDD